MNSLAAILFTLQFFGVTVFGESTVPLAIFTSDTIEFAPAKLGHVVSADLLSQTVLATLYQNVDKVVVIVLPKLSFSHLAYDTNYNQQKNTRFLNKALESASSVLYPSVSETFSLGLTAKQVYVPSSDKLHIEAVIGADRFVRFNFASDLNLKDADFIFEETIKLLNKSGHSYAVIFTAESSDDWANGIPASAQKTYEMPVVPEEKLSRGRRQATKDSKSAFVLLAGDCFLFYAKQFNFSLSSKDVKKTGMFPGGFVNISKECTKDEPFAITNDYKNVGDFTSLSTTMNVSLSKSGYWSVNSIQIDYSSGSKSGNVIFDTNEWLVAPEKFSFHCNNPEPTVKKLDKEFQAEIKFDTLQVEAYDIKDSQFSYPCDCVGFFTPAIWSGIVVTIIYLLIIALALSMLMNLETMDRFEDPKSQGLKIQAQG